MEQDALARLRRVEQSINDIPALQLQATVYDARVPSVTTLSAVSTNIAAKLTSVAIMWISPDDPTVERYEIWVSKIANNGSDAPYLAASVKNSPASFNIVSDAAGYGLATIRTIMKNGLAADLGISPSIPFQVF